MRPGRLDKLLYVGVAEDVASKANVLRALTRKFKLAPTVDLDAVARECAPTFTGADLYALCADAWMAGLKRIVAEVNKATFSYTYKALQALTVRFKLTPSVAILLLHASALPCRQAQTCMRCVRTPA